MAKEPSKAFIVSISKFKKNYLKKESLLKYNTIARVKLINDFNITKNEILNGSYSNKVNDPLLNDDVKDKIKHRIDRLNFFISTLPNEIEIPDNIDKNSKDSYVKYFILYRKFNKKIKDITIHHIVKEEYEIASSLIDSFYSIIDDKFVLINLERK